MDTARFQRERLTDSLWAEALPLLFAHWKEVAHYPDLELTPDRDAYAQLEARGLVRVFTARRDGLLIGYALFIVTPNLHYKQVLQANQDVVYIQPDQRGTMPLRFLQFCEDQLFAEGCDVICQHGKAKHPQLARLLTHMGYDTMDVLHVKRRPVLAPRAFPHIETSSSEARG
jgi:hypothetical protein